MAAGAYNFEMEQGATFNEQLIWSIDTVPVAMTGFTAEMQVRPTKQSPTTIAAFSTSDGSITLHPTSGLITIFKSASVTGTFSPGQFVYDLAITTPNATVTRLLAGNFNISAEVTR